MRIVLVRHGQSTWNLEHRIQGQTMGVPLTAAGRRQAWRAALQVRRMVPRHTPVWSSDQRRAVQTAHPIGLLLGSRIRTDVRLREQALGDMEGKLSSELEPLPVPRGQHIAEIRWGGGESVLDVWLRCRDLLHDLAADPHRGDAAILVTHGDTLRVMVAALDGGTHRDLDFTMGVGNGAVMSREVDLPTLLRTLDDLVPKAADVQWRDSEA